MYNFSRGKTYYGVNKCDTEQQPLNNIDIILIFYSKVIYNRDIKIGQVLRDV